MEQPQYSYGNDDAIKNLIAAGLLTSSGEIQPMDFNGSQPYSLDPNIFYSGNPTDKNIGSLESTLNSLYQTQANTPSYSDYAAKNNLTYSPQSVAAYNAQPGVQAAGAQYTQDRDLVASYLKGGNTDYNQNVINSLTGTPQGVNQYNDPNANGFNLGLAAAMFAAPELLSLAFPETFGAGAAAASGGAGAGGTSGFLGPIQNLGYSTIAPATAADAAGAAAAGGLPAGATEASLAAGMGFPIASAGENAALTGLIDSGAGAAGLTGAIGAGTGLGAGASGGGGIGGLLSSLGSTPFSTASLLSSGVTALGGVASSLLGANAQKDAASSASATQQGFFNTANQNLQPFIQTGAAASKKIGQLEGLDGSGPSNIQSTLQSLPGYQFENQQGLKSVQNSATARGLGTSGAAQKGAASYSTGLANQYYNNFLTGLQNTANTGAGAAGTLTGAATSTGSQIGSNTLGAGNATAASLTNSANSVGNAVSQIPNNILLQQILANQTGSKQGSSIYG